MNFHKVDPTTATEYVAPITDDDLAATSCIVAGYTGISVASLGLPPGTWVQLPLDHPDICHGDAGGLSPRTPWDLRPTVFRYIEVIARWSGNTPGTWAAANVEIAVFKNGTLYRVPIGREHVPTAYPLASVRGSMMVDVAEGDVVDVRVRHTGAGMQVFSVWDGYVDVHFGGRRGCAGCET